ncbi:MAG: hypothetical protein ABIP51_17130 [Bacteroidia bacterium]
MMMEKNKELIKRIKFLSEEANKRKAKIEKEVNDLEKICHEIIELQKRVENNEQNNGV